MIGLHDRITAVALADDYLGYLYKVGFHVTSYGTDFVDFAF